MSKNPDKKPSVPKFENAIVRDAYDQIIYDGIKESAGAIQDLVATDDNRDTLAADVFSSLYKSNPAIREDYRGFNRKLMQTMMGLEEYKTLRASTRFDDVCSAFGTMKLAPQVIETYEQTKKEQEQRQKEREKQKKQQGEKGQPGQPGGDQGDQPGDEDGDLDQDLQDQMRQSLREGLKDAQEASDEWGEMVRAWGLGPDELGKMTIEQKLELADKLRGSAKFKGIAELAGRFRNLAQGAATTTMVHGMDEIVDLTLGDDLSRLLPSELSKLHHTPMLFYKDMVERKLLQYNLKGVENKGYGPIIVCLDISPSMQGRREIFAKAIILALMFLAEKQKRSFGVITFGTEVHDEIFFDKKATMEQKMEIASIQCNGGGTNFYRPLKAAFKMRQDNMAKLNPADIVFITDGECEMSKKEMDEIQKLKRETEVRIQGVGICDTSHGEICRGETLVEFSDNLVAINSLGEMESVKGILGNAAVLTNKKAK